MHEQNKAELNHQENICKGTTFLKLLKLKEKENKIVFTEALSQPLAVPFCCWARNGSISVILSLRYVFVK